MPAQAAAFTSFFGVIPIFMVDLERQGVSPWWMWIPIVIMVIGIVAMIAAAKKEYLVSLSSVEIKVGKKNYKVETIIKIKVKKRHITIYLNQLPGTVQLYIKKEDMESILKGIKTWSSEISVTMEAN